MKRDWDNNTVQDDKFWNDLEAGGEDMGGPTRKIWVLDE